jgi:hypothetical protein
MAEGIHWEWRAFGAASGRFVSRFGELCTRFPPQGLEFPPRDFEDVYLWTPGLKVNVKVRDLDVEPFKFKLLQDKDGDLEKWTEKPGDIFTFPLDEDGWETLAKTLTTVNVALGPYPGGVDDRDTLIARVKEAGVSVVTVNKLRESRAWKGTHGIVSVERACISWPQPINSVGLETWGEYPAGQGPSDEQAKEDILAAIEALGLDQEPLRPMNYLDAVAVWGSGERIQPIDSPTK